MQHDIFPMVTLATFAMLSACERSENRPLHLLATSTAAQTSARRGDGESSRWAQRSGVDDDETTRTALITRSGPALDDSWTKAASLIFQKWSDAAPRELAGVCKFEAAACFAIGCMHQARCTDEGNADAMTTNFFTSAVYTAFDGTAFRSAPTVTQHGTTVTWLLERP